MNTSSKTSQNVPVQGTLRNKKILVATDHAGFELKNSLMLYLKELGCDAEDMGAKTFDAQDDYAPIMAPVALRIATEPHKYAGIVFGGSGNGEAMVSNRFPGVRAAVYYGHALEIVRLSREHNDANILSLGARFINEADMKEAVKLWLDTAFTGEERHARRINQIDEIM